LKIEVKIGQKILAGTTVMVRYTKEARNPNDE